MKKWILRRPQMVSGLSDPSFGSGVALQILIALMIYIAFNKASLVVVIPWIVWLVRSITLDASITTTDVMESMNASQGLILFSLFFTVVLIVFTLIYLRRIEKRPLSAAGISRRHALPRYLAGFGVGAVVLAACYIWPLLQAGITYESFTVFVPIYLAAFIIQSASEELLFRGMLVPGLSRRVGLLPAVLISSALFSVAHALNGGYSLLGGIYYLLIGAFLALLLLRTNSLWASCGFHGAWNFTIGLLLPMSISGLKIDYAIFHTNTVLEEAEATLIGDPYYLVFIGVFAVLIALLLFTGKNRLVVRASLPSQGAESTPETPAPQLPYQPAPGMPYYPPQPGQAPPAAPYYPPTVPVPGAPYYPYYPPTQPKPAPQQPLEETPNPPPTAPTPRAPYYPYYPPAGVPGTPYPPAAPTTMPQQPAQPTAPVEPSPEEDKS